MSDFTPREGLLRVLRMDFTSFIARSFLAVDPGAEYLPNWHIDLIAEYLEAARAGQIKRLVINMPPRALKSICVSVAWPAWILGHDPSARVMAASYALPLAYKHSIDCRMVMGEPWYQRLFPHTRLSRDQNEKNKFMTTARGYRIATSVGGTVTGEGGNYLIMDDPISALQAESKHEREQANRWFDHTFSTRLDDKARGVMVLVMQRLHAQDVSAHVLAKGGWEQLCLPALASSAEIYDFGRVCKLREEGEPLHEARESVALIVRAKQELGSRAFAAQYQQEPLAEEGGMVKLHWLQRYDTPPICERIVQSWDTAIKSGAQHDASVCLTFGESEGRHYLLDAYRMRAEYPDVKRAVVAQAARFSPHTVMIEDRASGQQLLQDLRRETALPLIAGNPQGDKVMRLAAASAMIEAGMLYVPRQAGWLAEFEGELMGFPGAAHDDQVDALTQYLGWVRGKVRAFPSIRRV